MGDNSRKIQCELGWRPRHDFADGLRRTAEWLGKRPGLRAWYREQIDRGRLP